MRERWSKRVPIHVSGVTTLWPLYRRQTFVPVVGAIRWRRAADTLPILWSQQLLLLLLTSILLLGLCTVWMGAVLRMFRRRMLTLSSRRKWVRSLHPLSISLCFRSWLHASPIHHGVGPFMFPSPNFALSLGMSESLCISHRFRPNTTRVGRVGAGALSDPMAPVESETSSSGIFYSAPKRKQAQGKNRHREKTYKYAYVGPQLEFDSVKALWRVRDGWNNNSLDLETQKH
jgi:hypothetical protein